MSGIMYGGPGTPKKTPGFKRDDNMINSAAYNKANPDEVKAQAAQAASAEDAEFGSWADQVEGRMGDGYKMNREYVRDNGYRDPKTGKPYSVDQGYATSNRSRAKDNYFSAFKQFGEDNRLPYNRSMQIESRKAFEKDYPTNGGQSYDTYNKLDAGKVAMYKDPKVFSNQQSAWRRSQAQPKPQVRKDGGLLYKK